MGRRRKPKEIELYVGTRKGGFIFRSNLRRKNWQIEGPHFPGVEVTHLHCDPRSGHLWAASQSAWFGPDLQVSKDDGKTWEKSNHGIEFQKDRGLNLARIWIVVPDRESRPETLWCGADPGALFRTAPRAAGSKRRRRTHGSTDRWIDGAMERWVDGSMEAASG